MRYTIKQARIRAGMTQRQLAEKLGVGIPQVSRWEAGKVNIPSERLIDISVALDANPFDLVTQSEAALIEANARPFKMEGASAERMRDDLPIYGSALGAAKFVDGEAIEQTTLNRAEVILYARRPVILNGNAAAYGLYVAGSSMEPRFFDGEILLADPKGRVRAGEDVVVYLRTDNPEDDNGDAARAVLVKRLVRRSSQYLELEQYHPRQVFRVDMIDVIRVDRVIPWQELLG